jgi:hypothetical protein
MKSTSRRLLGIFALACAVLLVGTGSVLAGTIIGTPKDDVLRGTAKADKLYGKAGNDRLLGLTGDDLLVGGPGNDVLRCGPGRDTALAGAGDTVAADCEVVRGLPKPALSTGDASVAEGSAGTTPLSFSVRLSRASRQAVSVRYATSDGTATAPADYAAASGTLTFKAGETNKTISVSIVGDTGFEAEETLTVTLSNPVGATIATASATGTIRNDDAPPPPVRPGHYRGMTSQNERFEFDVTPDGTTIARLVTGQINESCNTGFRLYWGRLDFGTDTIPISADASFTTDFTYQDTILIEGDPVRYPTSKHVTISGRFSGDTASGTLLVSTSFTYKGTQHSCTSNPQTWTATRTG